LDASDLFYSVFSLDSLGQFSMVPPAHMTRVQTLRVKCLEAAADVDTTRWLESTMQLVQLQRRCAGPLQIVEIRRGIAGLENEGGYGEKPNLRDTALGLRILDLLGEQLPILGETPAFVDSLQRRSGGFTNTADSLSVNLDIIAAGIECCALLRLPVRHREDILAFVLACQATDGSFSPVPVALPNIALTHQALKVIHALRMPEQSIGDLAL
jgi:prenyltransferase beta subunit